MTDLVATARALVGAPRGILAADESAPTATKRLASYGIATSEEMRRQYRELFLNAPRIEEYLSGVILHEETFNQKGSDKRLFRESLAALGIAPGIKVDQGTEPFPESHEEFITNGLMGLSERLSAFKENGAVFTKWRAVIRIDGDILPTASAIHENAKRLANYAKEAQAAGLVPILEPEVLREGKHSRQRAKAVLEDVLSTLFSVIEEHAVDRAGLILKTSMALSGSDNRHTDIPKSSCSNTTKCAMRSANVRRRTSYICLTDGSAGKGG